MKNLILSLLFILSFSACGRVSNNTASIPAQNQQTDSPKPIQTCEAKETAVPNQFRNLSPIDDNDYGDAAFQTPNCKVVAIGSIAKGVIHIERYQNQTLDISFNQTGKLDIPYDSKLDLGTFRITSVGQRLFFAGFASDDQYENEGIFAGLLDLDGNLISAKNSNSSSFLFQAIPNCKLLNPYEKSCSEVNQFDIFSMTVQGPSVMVNATYFDEAINKAVRTNLTFDTSLLQ